MKIDLETIGYFLFMEDKERKEASCSDEEEDFEEEDG